MLSTGDQLLTQPALDTHPFHRLAGFARALSRDKIALAAALVIGGMAVVACLAPWLAPHDPLQQDVLHRLEPPGWAHPLGTDALGRDILSRVIVASRTSMLAPLIAVSIALVLGVPPGLVAGYAGHRVDAVAARIADALLGVPPLVLAIAVVAALGPSMHNAMIGVGIIYAPRIFRVVRGATMAVRAETFIEGQRALGATPLRIIAVNVLPNVSSPIIVQATIMCGFAFVSEASLSYLGLGVQPPAASWGLIVQQGTQYLSQGKYYMLLPGVFIVALVLAFNVLGDWLRDNTAHRRARRS